MSDALQKPRILAALRSRPQGICQGDFIDTPAIDGGDRITRVAARIEDLEADGHKIDVVGKRNRYVVYQLVHDAGNNPTRAAEHLTVLGALALRRFHCCDACGFTWRAPFWVEGCPSCRAGAWWIASYYTRGAAETHVPLTPPELAAAA